MKVENIIKERIKENINLFTNEELRLINKSMEIMKKMYLLGLINGKEIYGKKLQ